MEITGSFLISGPSHGCWVTCVLRLSVTPSSMPWASARVSVTLVSLATPPGDITRLWDAPVWDRVVLGGRLETERQTVESFQRASLVCSALLCSALTSARTWKQLISLGGCGFVSRADTIAGSSRASAPQQGFLPGLIRPCCSLQKCVCRCMKLPDTRREAAEQRWITCLTHS